MPQDYSPAALALKEASVGHKSPRIVTAENKSPTLRHTKSAFDLSPRTSPTIPSTGFFGWARWYKSIEIDTLDERECRAKESPDEVVSNEVTNLFKEAFRRRKEVVGCDDASQGRDEPSFDEMDAFAWPDLIGGGDVLESNRSSLASSLNDDGTLPSLDLDDFPSSFEYSPPRARRSPPRKLTNSTTASSHLRSTQSNVTLKAPQILRRVSSSASILTIPVEVPPQNPHSPGSLPPSPTLSSDGFNLSPTLLSFSTTSSLESDSTSRSTSTVASTTSGASSACSSSTSTSAQSDSSFRSRISTLRKAASSAALKFFVPKEPPPALPPTASVLLRDVLLKHDQTHPDSPSPPLSSHAFYYYPNSSGSSHASYDCTTTAAAANSYDLEEDSPSSAFPPFDPFTTFDPTSPTKNSFPPPPFPPPPLSPRCGPEPRVLARQRSFIDPKTRALRTAPSLLCTPPTPDKTVGGGGGGGGGGSGGSGQEGCDDVGSSGETDGSVGGTSGSSEGEGGGGRGGTPTTVMRSRRKRGKRKSKSARNLREQHEHEHH